MKNFVEIWQHLHVVIMWLPAITMKVSGSWSKFPFQKSLKTSEGVASSFPPACTTKHYYRLKLIFNYNAYCNEAMVLFLRTMEGIYFLTLSFTANVCRNVKMD